MKLPFDPATAVPQLVAPGLEGMGERLVRLTLDTWAMRRTGRISSRCSGQGASGAKAARVSRTSWSSPCSIGWPGRSGAGRAAASRLDLQLPGRNRHQPVRDAVGADRVDAGGRPGAGRVPTIQSLLDPSTPLPGSPKKSSRKGSSGSRSGSGRSSSTSRSKSGSSRSRSGSAAAKNKKQASGSSGSGGDADWPLSSSSPF